jgi:hypothetical protein
MTLNSITLGGDFVVTNNCPAALAPAATCTLSVTFTPTTLGARTATLLVNGQAVNAPLSATVSGKGIPGAAGTTDYLLTVDKTTVTAAAGNTVTFVVSAKPLGGFNVPLAMTCTATGGLTCSASPSSISMDGTATGTTTITVGIPGPTYTRGAIRRSESFLYAVLPFGLIGGVFLVGRRRKRLMFILLTLVLLGMVLALNGCGGGGGSSSGSPWGGGTAPGTYTGTVTATGTINGTVVTHSLNLTITVQ